MANLNDSQLTLPLHMVDEPVYNAIVQQNWKLTFSRQRFTSVFTKRAMGLVAAQIRKDEEVKDFYQFRSADIMHASGITDIRAVYKNMETVLAELSNVVFFIKDEGKTIIPRHLIDSTNTGEYMCQYHNGILTLRFNPAIKPIIAQLGHIAKFELETYMRFSSWYSMRLWELLYPWRDTGWWTVDIEKYRDLMGCGAILDAANRPMKLKNGKFKYEKYGVSHSDAIKKTLAEPLKELVETVCEFEHEILYGEGRGKPIVGIKFTLVTRQETTADIMARWLKNDQLKAVIDTMRKWKISDYNFVKYAEAIGRERMFELNVEWQQKQVSKDRMKKIADYCNKVFIAEGEKAIAIGGNKPKPKKEKADNKPVFTPIPDEKEQIRTFGSEKELYLFHPNARPMSDKERDLFAFDSPEWKKQNPEAFVVKVDRSFYFCPKNDLSKN